MFKKVLKYFLLLLALLVVEVALKPNLPGVFQHVNVALVALIFVAVVYQFYLAATYGMILGFTLDLYSGQNFGMILVGLMVALYLIYLIFNHFLTNKSFYSLAVLNVLGTVFYNTLTFGYVGGKILYQTKDTALFKSMFATFGHNLLWQMLLNLALIILIFAIFHFRSNRFKAVFVDTTR